MKDSKLIYALNHLNVYELNKFKKFINSPYFNANKSLIEYFEVLEKQLKKSKKLLTKEQLFSKVFGKEQYKDAKFRKLNTGLLSLFEEFLAVENFSQKKLTKVNHLLSALSERRTEKLYNSILERSRRFTEQSFSKTSDFYFEQFNLQKNIFNLTTEFERKAKSKKKISDFNVVEISSNLDLFYIIEKLRYMCTVLSWQSVRSDEVQINFMDEIITIVENSALLRNRVVEIYYQIYQTHIDEENEAHYFKLKNLIENYLDIFPTYEAKEIFEAALTSCVKKANKGFTDFQLEVLELYKYALQSDILIIDGFLSPTTFRNITTYALRAREFDWAEDFINQYQEKLDPKFAESIIAYNNALLNFYKKDFKRVIEHLSSFEFDEINYSLGAKNILLSTFYELDEIDALDSLLDSFRAYVERNPNIIERFKQYYKNLIRFTKQLTKLLPSDKLKIEKLRQEIVDCKNLASRQWLLEKVDEL